MFTSIAHASGSMGGAMGGADNFLVQFGPLLIMLGIFYFLLIRPQQKRAKEHKAMLAALKKGDTIITNAGFIGRIIDIDDDILTVDLGETKVQIGRSYVGGMSNHKLKGGKTDKKEKESKETNADQTESE